MRFIFRQSFFTEMIMAYRPAVLAPYAAAAALWLSIGLVQPAASADDGIQLLVNQAKIVKLARAADTIVVGNPQIADTAVQDATTIVLTGKGFGVTNLVVLDEDGQPIVDEQLYVARQDAKSVRIYRRADVQTLSCTPFCESSYKSEAERLSESEISAGR
jgi:Flp pilus assembly secretin CpaC